MVAMAFKPWVVMVPTGSGTAEYGFSTHSEAVRMGVKLAKVHGCATLHRMDRVGESYPIADFSVKLTEHGLVVTCAWVDAGS